MVYITFKIMGVNMKKIKVSINDYWDYFWQQFNSEYYECCQGYADYDECYKRTKILVDSQIEC